MEKFPQPFADRHPSAIGEAIGLGIIPSPKPDKSYLLQFTESILNYAMVSGHLSKTLKDLAVDVAISVNNYKAIINLTDRLEKPSYYVYRAYALYKRGNIQQISNLLNLFHKELLKTKTPEHLLIYASIECLVALSSKNWAKLDETLVVINYLLKDHPELHKNFFVLLIYLFSAEAYIYLEKLEQAEEKAFWVHKAARSLNDPYYQLKALTLLANIGTAQGDWQKAQRLLSQAIPLVAQTGEKKDLLLASARLELAMGNFERALSLLKQALEHTGEDFYEYISIVLQIVELCLLTNNRDDAGRYLKNAIEINQKYMLNMLEPYLYAAWVALENNELHDAFVLLNFCKEELEKRPNPRLQIRLLYLLGIYEYKMKLFDVAIDDFKEANRLALKNKNYEYVIKTQIEIANLSLQKFAQTRELADFSQALQAIDDLQFLAVEQKIPKLICGVNLLKGYLLLLAEKTEQAKESLKQAVVLAEQNRFLTELQQAKNLLNEIKMLETSKSDMVIGKKLQDIDVPPVPFLEERLFIPTMVKREQTILYGIAIVEMETGVMKYRFKTEHDVQGVTSLIPTTVAAVNMYAHTILDNSLSLTHIREEGYEMLIENLSDKFLVIAIVDQITFQFKQQFIKFTNVLKENEHLLHYYDFDQITQEVGKHVEEYFKPFVKKDREN